MKKCLILALLGVSAVVCAAQTNRFPPINLYTGDPTGNACTGNLIQQSNTTGLIYTCQSGTMKVGGTTGSGTVSGQTVTCLPKASSASVLSSASAVCDNGTTVTSALPIAGTGATFSANVTAAAALAGSVNGLMSTALVGVSDLRTYSNVVITAASQTLVSSNAAFVAGDVGKLINVPMGTQGIATTTYSSDTATVTGNSGQTCLLTTFNGGGTGAKGIISLTGANSITSGIITLSVFGTGYSSLPTTATLASGSATCSGGIVLTGGTFFYTPVTTTITGVTNSTTATIGTPATSTVNGTFAYGAWIGTDNSALMQAQVTASRTSDNCVTIPPGKYALSTALIVTGGECIMGWNGFLSAANGAALYPGSGQAAIATPNPLTNNFAVIQNIKIKDLFIVGGQNGLDLGLSHFLTINDISCADQIGWCISHIIGERHRIENIQCFHFNTAGQGCISVSDWTHSIYASSYTNSIVTSIFNAGVASNVATVQNNPANSHNPAVGQSVTISGLTTHAYLNGTWTVTNSGTTVVQFAITHADDALSADSGTLTHDWSDEWFDKSVMERISDQGADSYTIWSDGNVKFPASFSNTRLNYVSQFSSNSYSMFRAYGVQSSNFSDMNTDAVHSSAPAVFDVYGVFLYNHITNLALTAPGSSFANGIYLHNSFVESTISDSAVGGDNINVIGYHIGNSSASDGCIMDSKGSVFTDASSIATQNHVCIIGGLISPTNMLGSINFSEQTNNDANFLLSGDQLGNVAATSKFKVTMVTNVQTYKDMFHVDTTGPVSPQGSFTFTPLAVDPATPTNGQCWTKSTGLFCRFNGSTVGPIPCTNACGFTGTVTFQGGSFSSTLGLASGSALSWSTDLFLGRLASGTLSVGTTAGAIDGQVRAAQFRLTNSGFLGSMVPTTLTASRTYTYPDFSGTVALAAATTAQTFNAPIIVGQTKFTATGCTSITSTVGNGTAGKFVIGANTCTVAITLNGATGMAAASGWSCSANDETTAAGNTGLYFSANNTTTATLTVPATAVASDVIDFQCRSF